MSFFNDFFRLMRPCPEHDFQLLTFFSPVRETSSIADSFAVHLSPSVLERAQPLGLWIPWDAKREFATKPRLRYIAHVYCGKFRQRYDLRAQTGISPLKAPKRFRCAEVLFHPSFHSKTYELPDGYIIFVGARNASVARTCCSSQGSIPRLTSSQTDTSFVSAPEMLPLCGCVVPALFQTLQSVCYNKRLIDACVYESTGYRREGGRIVSCQLEVSSYF